LFLFHNPRIELGTLKKVCPFFLENGETRDAKNNTYISDFEKKLESGHFLDSRMLIGCFSAF